MTQAEVRNITDEQYHADPALSKTKLSEFIDSAEIYYHRHILDRMCGKKETASMATGSIIHECLLLNKSLAEVVDVIPADCLTAAGAINSRGKAWQDFCFEAQGYKVKLSEYNAIKAILDSESLDEIRELVMSNRHRSGIEQPVFWIDEATGVGCRCKPDLFIHHGDRIEAFDLKVSPFVSPVDFKRQVKRFRYWLQDRHYSSGLYHLFGKRVSFTFLVLEPTYPYRVRRYSLDLDSRALADSEYRRHMQRFAECQESGVWVDQWPSELSLSAYDVGAEIESDDLDWGGKE